MGMLSPLLPACGGASDHEPGNGGGAEEGPPWRGFASPGTQALRREHLEKVHIWHRLCLLGGQGCAPSLSFLILKVERKHPFRNE